MSDDKPKDSLAALKAKLATKKTADKPVAPAGVSAADRLRAKMEDLKSKREEAAKASAAAPTSAPAAPAKSGAASKASAPATTPPAPRPAAPRRKSPATDEPTSKLRDFLALRVEDLLTGRHSELERVARQVGTLKGTTDLDSWIGLYGEAMALATSLRKDVDKRFYELGSLDPRDIKIATEELYDGPRAQFDQLRTGLIAESKTIVGEWENRTKRLLAELGDRARQRCDHVEVTEANANGALQLSISDAWLEQFRRDVHDGGLASLGTEVPRCLEQDLGRLRLMCSRHALTGSTEFNPPAVPALDFGDGSWVERARYSEKKKRRGLFESVMREIRTQLMSLKYLFGMVVSAPLAVGAFVGSDGGAPGAIKGAAMNTGAVLGLVTPLLIGYAIWSGRRDREDQREELVDMFATKAKTEVERHVQTALKSSESKAMQWLETRRFDCTRSIEDWFARSIEPQLATRRRQAEATGSEMTGNLERKKDEADVLKTLSRKLGALGTDLAKRRLELEDALHEERSASSEQS